MSKNSTLFSDESFISHGEKDIKVKALPDNQLCPWDAVINNILSFSKALTVKKSKDVGLIEIVLN